jgi:hypothetical protein
MQNDIGQLTPAVLLPVFYSEHNLGLDGGHSSSSVRIDINKNFHFFIPNYDARRKAVLWHDIHHLVTGYSAGSFLGECEISAWEIASGCKKYWAAFVIDTSGVVLGCFINPKRVIQAYARGRRTLNLYHDIISKEKVMHMKIDDLRRLLLLDKYPYDTSPGVKDIFMFGLFLVFGFAYSILSILQIPFIIMYNLLLRR